MLKNTINFIIKNDIEIYLAFISMHLKLIYSVKYIKENLFVYLTSLSPFLFAFIFAYSLNRITDKEEDLENDTTWYQIKNLHLISLFISIIIAFAFIENTFSIYLYIFCIIFSVLYSYPPRFRLKNIFLIKDLLPPLLWYISMCAVLMNSMHINNTHAALDIMYKLLPMLPIMILFEIFWDMPDIRGDIKANVSTIPTLLGFQKARLIIITSLLVQIISQPTVWSGISAAMIIVFLVISNEQTKKIEFKRFLLLLITTNILFTILSPLI